MEQVTQNQAPTSRITRRSFLKTSALVGGTLALTGCSAIDKSEDAQETGEVQEYQGLCRGNCGGGCRIKVRVRDGKVISTGPTLEPDNPLDFLICPRGLSQIQRIYAPERIKYPLRRVEGTKRGDGQWERLSWDEAIDYICTKWKGYMSEYGLGSIGYSYGAGTYAQNYYMYMRLFMSLGALKIAQENDMTLLNVSWKMYGMSLFMVGNQKSDEMNSKTFFIWGTNATVGTFNRWKYLCEAIDNGAKMVVIDPTYTLAAQKSDLWLPIKPGTDAALAMCFMKYWHDNGLEDKSYLRDMSVAPFLVRQDTGKFFRADEAGIEAEKEPDTTSTSGFGLGTTVTPGKYPLVAVDADGNVGLLKDISEPAIEGSWVINGVELKTAYTMLMERCSEWTLEKTAETCDLSVDLIEKAANMYLDGPTMLHTGFGFDHRGSGLGASIAVCTLPIVSGQIGKNGAGISGNLAGATTGFAGDNWMFVATSQYKSSPKGTNMNYLSKIVNTQSWCGKPLYLKSIFFYVCNPLGSYGGTTEIRETLEKIDLIVYAETVWNDTARYADVILPVPHWFEYETYRTTPNPYIDFNDECIPPQFESKPDTEIIRLLGIGMDLNVYGEFDHTNEEFHKMFLDTDTSAQYGVSWDTLKQVKHMPFATFDYNYGSRYLPWGTVSKRAEFYFEDVEPEFDSTIELDTKLYALAFQSGDNEAYDENPLKAKYPINLFTHRDKFKVHTAFAQCPWFLEIQPEPTIELNPVDAEKYGVAEGDYARAYNDRGFCVFKVHIDSGMRPGCAWTEHTWVDTQYKAGHYADLTHMKSNDFFPSNVPFDTLVAIEKWEA